MAAYFMLKVYIDHFSVVLTLDPFFFLSHLYAMSANNEKKNVKSMCLVFTAQSNTYLVISVQCHSLNTKSKGC